MSSLNKSLLGLYADYPISSIFLQPSNLTPVTLLAGVASKRQGRGALA